MKSPLLALLAVACLAGCASVPDGRDTAAAKDPNSVYNDPT